MHSTIFGRLLCLLLFASYTCVLPADEKLPVGWKAISTLDAAEARQAVAVEGDSVYAIDNQVIAKYDRKTGERLAVSTGTAHHLNSGFIFEGQLYCAHSNFPAKPEKSEIKKLDLATMQLTDFKIFKDPPGSLTVVLNHDGQWWCVFAHYGEDKGQTRLIRYDAQWQETGCWSFPESVLNDLGKYAISGGVWQDGLLLATGHDKKVIYRLQLAEQGTTLMHLDSRSTPFPGQGIAFDPQTDGLVGINRAKKQVIFAEKVIQ